MDTSTKIGGVAKTAQNFREYARRSQFGVRFGGVLYQGESDQGDGHRPGGGRAPDHDSPRNRKIAELTALFIDRRR
jgi:hypothetical protein